MSRKKLKKFPTIPDLLNGYRKNCEIILKKKPLIKGTLVKVFVHCGRQNCHCIKKKTRHEKIYLKYSQEGKIQSTYVRIDQRNKANQLTDNYRTFRTARANLVKIHSEILKQIDDIVKKNLLTL